MTGGPHDQRGDPRPEAHCLEFDQLDAEAWRRIGGPESALEQLGQSGHARLPGFPTLLQDLFYAFYKGNVRLIPSKSLPPKALVSRRILGDITGSRGFVEARRVTLMDEEAAATATAHVGRQLLSMLKSGDFLLRDESLDAHRIEQAEADLDEMGDLQETLDDLTEEAETGRPLDDEVVGPLREALDEEAGDLADRVQRGRQRAEQMARELPKQMMGQLTGALGNLPQRLMELDADVDNFNSALGGGAPMNAAQRLALGEQLMRSDRLRKLAALVGAFRKAARVQRKRKIPQRSEEVHDVTRGADADRLLASELSALSHPTLRLDVQRRFVERQLLQYDLKGDDDRGRGPVITCVDLSGSMRGAKELWAKAVGLFLLETARRQRRPLRTIGFCAPPTPLHIRDLLGARPGADGRRPVHADAVVDFAEHFPGGGTDFQTPLTAALEALGDSRYRRGDIVFITDGEAQVGAEFLERFHAEKKRLAFRVWGVLVDTGPKQALASALSTLEQFCDEVSLVSELTADAAVDIAHKLIP
ncbi:MAG: hypothetical protein ACE366_24540 [Bradymonadia bacterium]